MAAKIQRTEEQHYPLHNNYEIFRCRDTYPHEAVLHHHDFYEICFFLSGNVQYNIESRSYLLSPGDVLLISPMELHQPMLGSEQRSFERIVVWIDKHFLESFGLSDQRFTDCFDTTHPGHTNLLRPDGAQRQLLAFQLEQMLAEAEAADTYCEISTMAYLAQVLILLNRQAKKMKPEDVKTAQDSVVYYILTYINDHYSEDLSLDYLANKFFTSKYHLSREFQRLVGTSVHRYIIQKRLVMAKQMMSQGLPSTEVYQHCGFGDYSNFYRAFKQEYHISPKEFVARLKGSAIQSDGMTRRLRERIEK